MADYVQLLRDDLLEQFKDKPVIDALMEAIGTQLNDVRQFFEDLRDKRSIQTAEGKQLDGAGDIVVLSRMEAGALACINKSVFVLDDESYRQHLIFKAWKNTNNCTYYDIIKALRMFWERPLYYREDPEKPATMIFDTDILTPEDDVLELVRMPICKAAGVACLLRLKYKPLEHRLYTGFAVRMGRRVTVGCAVPAELDVTYMTDENGDILADEAGKRIIE